MGQITTERFVLRKKTDNSREEWMEEINMFVTNEKNCEKRGGQGFNILEEFEFRTSETDVYLYL